MFIFSIIKNFVLSLGIRKILTIVLSIAAVSVLGGMAWKIHSLKNEKDEIAHQLLTKQLEYQQLQTRYAQEREELLKKVLEQERKLNRVKSQLEDENAKHKKELEEVYNSYLDYIESHGMYDPGNRESTSNSTSQGVSSNPNATSESERSCNNQKLSRTASEFLLSLTLEADELLADYKTCYNWAKSVSENHVTP